MAGNVISVISDALRIYQPFVADQTVKQNFFYNKMKKKPAVDKGQKVTITLKKGYNRGLGIRAESTTLPTPGQPAYDTFDIPRTYPWIGIKFSQQVIEIAKSADMVGEAASILDQEIKDAADVMAQEYNRIMYNRDASGAMARINQGSPATTLQLDAEDWTPSSAADTTFSTKYLREGDVLRGVATRTGGSESATDITVQGFDHDNNQVKVSAVTGLSDGDYLVRQGNYGLEQVGLLGACAITDNTYMGIDRSLDANSYWRPNIFYNDSVGDGTGNDRILTDVFLQKMVNTLTKRYKAKDLYLIMHQDTELSLQQYLSAGGRYDFYAHGTPVSGFDGTTVRISGKQVTIDSDEYCPKNVVFLTDMDKWNLWQIGNGFRWADDDGSILKWTQPADGTYTGYGMFWAYPVNHRPQTSGFGRDILVP